MRTKIIIDLEIEMNLIQSEVDLLETMDRKTHTKQLNNLYKKLENKRKEIRILSDIIENN
jgi:tRNA A37 methylthiotransferase MiaB